MSFLLTVVIGSIVGAVSKVLMRGRDFAALVALGIIGSIIAGGMQYGENQPLNPVASLVGSIILVTIYRLSANDHEEARTSERTDFRRAA